MTVPRRRADAEDAECEVILMDIEIIEMTDRKAKFLIKDSSPAMANALRRTLLRDIPKMAIDKVEFHLGPSMVDGREFESNTPLFDEIIAHRLGMVPVPTDFELFGPQENCVCGGEGCPNCTIMYSLNKHGPATLMSGDLMPLGDQTLKVKDEFIPIVELNDGQAVLIYAIANMGTARQHIKWQAAFGVGYRYLPHVSVKGKCDGDCLKVAEMCPKHVFSAEGGKLKVVKEQDCVLCMTCVEETEPGVIEVTADDRNFIFSFETDGSMTSEQALNKAIEILSKEYDGLKGMIKAF